MPRLRLRKRSRTNMKFHHPPCSPPLPNTRLSLMSPKLLLLLRVNFSKSPSLY
ncbi:hypothetical protein GBA52_023914 [Prunus armeniaca]|nr:hypothetical protein GBA52_023914 [Prunus armeniaca]